MSVHTEFMECDFCSRNGKTWAGGSLLCPSCIHNRDLISDLKEKLKKKEEAITALSKCIVDLSERAIILSEKLLKNFNHD